jgi:hypothetical protein
LTLGLFADLALLFLDRVLFRKIYAAATAIVGGFLSLRAGQLVFSGDDDALFSLVLHRSIHSARASMHGPQFPARCAEQATSSRSAAQSVATADVAAYWNATHACAPVHLIRHSRFV